MSPLARYVLACIVAAVLAGTAAWRVQEWRWTAATTAEKLAQSEAARQREKGVTIANAKNDKDLQNEKARDAAVIRATGDKLRDLQSALGSGVDSAPLGGADDPRDSIIDQCATALTGLDAEVKGLARTATGLQRYASNVCLMR